MIDYDSKSLVLHLGTVQRLFEELGADGVALYLFYSKQAKIQKTSSVKATTGFCEKGMKWGRTRVENTRNLLIEHGYVKKIQRKDNKGKILGHYILVKFDTNAVIEPDFPEDGKTTCGFDHMWKKEQQILSLKKEILILKKEIQSSNSTNSQKSPTPSLVENLKNKKKDLIPRLDEIKEVVSFLNEKSGKEFRYQTKNTQSHIGARLKEGFTVDELKRVIELKCKEWLGDKDMEQYIRPQTLFAGKFESYLQSAPKKENKPIINEW